MIYTNVGRSGLKVSRLTLGTMSFGAEADESESARLYGRCRDAGVIHFDCANIYSGGRAEEILGRLVAPERDSIVLATKAYFPMGDGPNDRGASRYHLIRAVEASLRRLKTDRIDILYLHRFDEETTLEESLRALDALILAGKVVYPGVSNFAAWQVIKANGLAEMKGWSRLACVQSMYSLLKRQAEVEILPMALAEGLGVFAYSPLAAGMLTGRYGVDKDPEHGRIVDNPRYQVRYGDPSFRQAADAFLSLAADRGVHPVSLAIRWVLEHPAVTAAVLGARSVDQLEPQLESLLVPWDDSLRAAVSALTPEPPPPTDRNEEREGH